MVVRNDRVNWWAIYLGSWSSNGVDWENISRPLVYLTSHVVLLGRIPDISFSAYILLTIFFAPILTLDNILATVVHFLLPLRENKECIGFIDENHGFIFIAFNLAYLIVLQKILNESRFSNLADLVLLKLKETQLMVCVTAPGKHHLFLLCQGTLKGRIGSTNMASWCSRTEGWSLISHIVISTTCRVKLSDCHGSRATSRSTYGYIMIAPALNICNLSIEQSKNHLGCRYCRLGIFYD